MRRALALLMAIWLAVPAAADTIHRSGPMPEPLYVGQIQFNVTIRAQMSREAEAVGYYSTGDRVYILDYEPEWLHVVKGEDGDWMEGYILRHAVDDVKRLAEDILPYGTTPAAYSARIVQDTPLYLEPDEDATPFFILKEGSRLAVLAIEDGWAQVIYWRQYGYFRVDDAVAGLTPVYDPDAAVSGDTMAAFHSFYNISTDSLNLNRMHNIAQACEYISIPLASGDAFAFNSVAGPYRYSRGYLDGMSYFEGEAVLSVGGGTCQVSSTLYNVLLALDEGISVLYRRAHGPSGATYLPHGVDAAVGSDTLDLRFRNDFDFSVRIQAESCGGVLYIAMLKE